MKKSYLIKSYFAREFKLVHRLLYVDFAVFDAALSPPPNAFLPFRLELTEKRRIYLRRPGGPIASLLTGG